MPPTIRTATINALTESFQTVRTLMGDRIAGISRNYDDATIENKGAVPIYVSVCDDETQQPSTDDATLLDPGQSIPFAQLDTQVTYIATTDLDLTNQVTFFGRPVFR